MFTNQLLEQEAIYQQPKNKYKTFYLENLVMSLVTKQPTRDAELKFPCKLYRMLMDTESKGLIHIVSWHKEGRCFRVHDQEAFVKEILPKYFKKSKYRSFQRQCNLYGFHRITAVKPFWDSCYYHPAFIRGDEGCCRKITRPLRESSKGAITNITTPTTPTAKINIKGNQNEVIYPVTSISRTILSEDSNVSTQVRSENLISTHVLSSSSNAANVTTPITFSSYSNQGNNNSKLNVTEKQKQKSRRTSYQEFCYSILGDDYPLCDDNGQQLVQSLLNV